MPIGATNAESSETPEFPDPSSEEIVAAWKQACNYDAIWRCYLENFYKENFRPLGVKYRSRHIWPCPELRQ